MRVVRKRQSRLKRWLARNGTGLALVAIIILSMMLGAITCYAIVTGDEKTFTTETITPPITEMETEERLENMKSIAEEEAIFYFDVPLSYELQDYIRDLCVEYGVPMELVIAMIEQESSFRPYVVSKSNDYGLMQINTVNHNTLSEKFGITDFLDPRQNVLCGIYIISGHLRATNENIELALMRYNGGASGAKRLWEQGIYSTSYSSSISNRYEFYKQHRTKAS